MVRTARRDAPDTWHHVFNRGIAKRTLFERREDFRHFMALLACSVRRGEIEVHAYALMGTHFHLLVRSPDGLLAQSMQRIQLAYSRRFNRTRRRDGPLVRGRYGSRLVDSLRYRRVLVAYIDANPVRAGLVERAAEYPWGSASAYARLHGPTWLERGWVESEVHPGSGDRVTGPRTTSSASAARASKPCSRSWIEGCPRPPPTRILSTISSAPLPGACWRGCAARPRLPTGHRPVWRFSRSKPSISCCPGRTWSARVLPGRSERDVVSKQGGSRASVSPANSAGRVWRSSVHGKDCRRARSADSTICTGAVC